jgi:nucleoside-diphosphate-sugar epimerase
MILITGATGFIGARLAARLAADGAAIRCFVREGSKRDRLPASAEIVTSLDTDVDTVFHVAGVTKALAQSDYQAGNVTLTQSVLDACVKRPPRRLVHVSSIVATNPVSAYGASKLAGEELVRRSSIADRAVIIRPPVVYGPGDTDVLRFFRAVASGWIVSTGQRVSIIHVDDLVDALLLASRSDAGGTYCVSNPDPVEWRELGELAARLMGRKARVVRLPMWAMWSAAVGSEWVAQLTGKPSILSRDKLREARQPEWICDPAAARLALGFETRLSLEQGVAQTLTWGRFPTCQ